MNRKETTTADKLQIGDRFYKATDRARLVLVRVQGDHKQPGFRVSKLYYCEGSVMDNPKIQKEHKSRNYKAINGETAVIFLRHATN